MQLPMMMLGMLEMLQTDSDFYYCYDSGNLRIVVMHGSFRMEKNDDDDDQKNQHQDH